MKYKRHKCKRGRNKSVHQTLEGKSLRKIDMLKILVHDSAILMRKAMRLSFRRPPV